MTYCINVYKSLRYANSGEVMFCCKSTQRFYNDQGAINLQNCTMKEALYSESAIEIRNALENNIRHANCKKCWDEEDAGIASKRMLDNDRAKEYWGQDYLENKKIEPDIVELNLGTTCNLKCRICGPWSSSKWMKEHYDLRVPVKNANEYKNYIQLVKYWGGDWSDESKAWDHIEQESHQFKQLEFYGGEPFLVEKNWELLNKIIEKGHAKNQVLHFNTNATLFNEEYVNLLKEFKFVRISLSIDGIGERFEYQRHPSDWAEVSSNIKKFMQLQKENPNIEVNVCSTISSLNVYYIDELINFLIENDLSGYYVNFLHFPDYFNMKNIKEDVKSKLTNYLTKKQDSFDRAYDKDSIQKIINYMNSKKANETLWNHFLSYTKKTDEYRKENFDKTFQEWSRMINEDI
jgi:hypothetical protein